MCATGTTWNFLLCSVVYDKRHVLNLLSPLAEKAYWLFYIATHFDTLDNSSHSHSNLLELILSIDMIAQWLLLLSWFFIFFSCLRVLLSNEHLGFASLSVGDKNAAASDEPAKLAAPDAFQLSVLPSKHWVGAATIADKFNSEAAVVVVHCLFLSLVPFDSCIIALAQHHAAQIHTSPQTLHNYLYQHALLEIESPMRTSMLYALYLIPSHTT